MVKGDAVGGVANVNAAAYMTIQPSAGIELIVHNVYHEAGAKIYIVEGSNKLCFDTHTEGGAWATFFFHVSNTHYLEVENTDAGVALIGYDGIISKE